MFKLRSIQEKIFKIDTFLFKLRGMLEVDFKY